MIRAVGNKVLVVPDESAVISPGGVHLVSEETQMIGTVLSVGARVNGINEGDAVAYQPFVAQPVEHQRTEYLVLDSEHILAVLG